MQNQTQKTMWEHREKVAVYKLGRESSPETEFADTVIMNFQPPGLW
jgi:hypothetical protein